MGCGDTKTVKAHICLDYNHVYWLWLCEKHAKELREYGENQEAGYKQKTIRRDVLG
jgi:hypothetical protein